MVQASYEEYLILGQCNTQVSIVLESFESCLRSGSERGDIDRIVLCVCEVRV